MPATDTTQLLALIVALAPVGAAVALGLIALPSAIAGATGGQKQQLQIDWYGYHMSAPFQATGAPQS